MWQERITIDPNVLTGKPVIKGTRLAVEFIIELLANRWTEAEIFRNYPGITHEDILACLKSHSRVQTSEHQANHRGINHRFGAFA